MKRLFQTVALIAALTLPALCQYGRLSSHEQHEFDEAYSKWVKDTRKNDRDDVARDVRKMQKIMERNNIPPDVPFDRIASNGYSDRDRYNNDQGRYDNRNDRNYRDQQSGSSRLAAKDQRDFDHYYSRWVDDSRRNDRDDADSDARHMQDIMARNNIPSNVPYEQIATAGGYQNNGYNDNNSPGSYPAYSQSRLSPDDQREFDKVYSRWVNDSRKNDRDDIERDQRKMQDIMARYNIPSDVPYDQVASQGAEYRH